MGNPGILNWRRWSLVRKSQVIGTLIGVVLSSGIIGVTVVAEPQQPGGALWLLLLLVCWPACKAAKVLGWDLWLYSGDQGFSWMAFGLIVLTDSLLFFLGGGFVGWMARRSRNSQEEIT